MRVSWKLLAIPTWGDAVALLLASETGLSRLSLCRDVPYSWLDKLNRSEELVGSYRVWSPAGATQGDPSLKILDQSIQELAEYLDGDRTEFSMPFDLRNSYEPDDLPEFVGPDEARGSEFDQSIWEALFEIPLGELQSYGELAERIGHTRSSARAVGGAVGRNPIGIIVPCHRIVGASGHLTGFSAGLPLKVHLLGHEGFELRSLGGTEARWKVLGFPEKSSASQNGAFKQLEVFPKAS